MAEPEWVPRETHIAGGYYRVYVWHPVERRKVWCVAPDGTKRFASRLAAQQARDALQRQLDDGLAADGVEVARQVRSHSFRQVAETWAATYPASAQSSQAAQRSHVRMLVAAFGDTPIDDLHPMQVRSYFARLADEGRASSLRASRLEYLRKIVTDAVTQGLRTGDPTEGLKIRVRRMREPTYLTDQQMIELCYHLPRRFWPALLLSYDCGLRAAEIAGLRWHRLHLDGDDPHVAVRDVMDLDHTVREYPKGMADATAVALTPRVVAALRELRRWRGDVGRTEHVFLNRHHRPMRAKDPNAVLRRAFERSGLGAVIERPTWHHLRHACATRLAEADAPATVIQGVLRHESLETSQRYIREASTQAQREWMQRRDDGGGTVVALDARRAS